MMFCNRGVAQPGSAPGLGPGGRRFESCRPDATKNPHRNDGEDFLFYFSLELKVKSSE